MKNINYYSDNSMDFHKAVLLRKKNTSNDPSYKSRIEILESQISNRFTLYDSYFIQNSLELMDISPFSINEKDDLKKLYSYKSKIIKELKIALTTTDTNRIINTCPNCTISEINSFDHYLPQEKFPEFVVNPKNLFPSCTTCNSHKNASWIENERRIFLNLYLDQLPNLQYLFIEYEIDKNVIVPHFYLNNSNNIDENLYCIIESHYYRLRLCDRFKENSNETISYMEDIIKTSLRGGLSQDKIIDIISGANELQKISFGYNYWKSIL
ncbi:HNH endonuclease [Entomomonas asaccharolytica]|uniref:HNH endonuclease n=2 Tax=Entomomonas asaccharolytica TaxID=2785331 RepID=A0A974NHH9_9GAMM|nr:HNH endonuclease [Entomomonas asaccharolytica]QQP86574.1 HNH endonuclease [Entomomonas asaccharolytica]